ncbi:MAG: co-chaperone GroES [Candidatus Omnitrophica bacterium]|nr:co-chaperone GroES [Candidatus Omnitrophota bacterium]
MEIKPLADRILVKWLEEKEERKGGIIIPDTAKEKPQQAEVKAIGPGKCGDEGKIIPLQVKVGDNILISKYGGTEVEIDGEEYLIMREEDVMAVIK